MTQNTTLSNSPDDQASNATGTPLLSPDGGGGLLINQMELHTSHEVTAGFAPNQETNALNIQDLISDHASSHNHGGYLNFTIENGVVTLGIDMVSPNSGSASHVTLATIEGATGLSNTQILNTLLANHEIKFD